MAVMSLALPIAGVEYDVEAVHLFLTLLVFGILALGLLYRAWLPLYKEVAAAQDDPDKERVQAKVLRCRSEPLCQRPDDSSSSRFRRASSGIPSATGQQAIGKQAEHEAVPRSRKPVPWIEAPWEAPWIGAASPSRTTSDGRASSGSGSPCVVADETAIPPMPEGVSPKLERGGLPVLLHVYDVSHEEGIQIVNDVFANTLASIKLGGVFHAGVEILGKEWSFGHCVEGSGVSPCEPRRHPMHHFRETVELQNSVLSEAEVKKIIDDLVEEYQGCEYHLVQRNCCHFAEDLCQRLGAGELPSWLYRLARIGSNLLEGIEKASQGLADMVGDIRLSRNWESPAIEQASSIRERHFTTVDRKACD